MNCVDGTQVQPNSPLDSAVITEGNEPEHEHDGNDDGNDDGKPEDQGRSHTIIIFPHKREYML